MSQIDRSLSPDLQTEIAQLRQELQIRDQLVDQLSQELFQLIQGHPEWVSPVPATPSQVGFTEELEQLRQQLQSLGQQIGFYQEQIAHRDAEMMQLRQVNQILQESQQDLTQRNQKLEQLVQDLPEVYRQKFSQRLSQVKEKLAALEQENNELKAQLQGMHNPALPLSSTAPSEVTPFPPTNANGQDSRL